MRERGRERYNKRERGRGERDTTRERERGGERDTMRGEGEREGGQSDRQIDVHMT